MHVSNIIDKAARALCGLKTIRSHGLTGESLHDVTRATLTARLIYAAPAWWGFVSLAERDRMQSVIICLVISLMSLDLLMLLIPTYSVSYCVTQTMLSTNNATRIEKTTGYNLWKRSHNLTLPVIDNNVLMKNFLYRLLSEICISCICLWIVFIAYCFSLCTWVNS